MPGVPANYGGICFKYNDPNTLLIGGSANNAAGVIYSIQLQRNCTGGIMGFVGRAQFFASAPSIDGGLAYGPNHVLFYTTYNNNTIGQILPGETTPAKIIDLTPLGIASSTGALAFTPTGFGGAGQLKILSYNGGQWYHANVVADGGGTYNIVNVTEHALVGGGPEGVVYINNSNPQFSNDSVLVSEYGTGRIVSYEVDGNGDPIVATRRTFVDFLSGAEGAVVDPISGHFLFSTFGGGNRVILVNGFNVPCPGDLVPPGGNQNVDVNDLLAVINLWGQTCVTADINHDGTVNVNDLLVVINRWGPCQ